MGIRRAKAEWLEIVEEFKSSGKTMAAFSKDYGINVKTLGNYVHKEKTSIENTVKKRSLKEWRILIDAQRNSGMKPAEWCRQHGISPDTMRAATRRLKESAETLDEIKWVELGGESKHNISMPIAAREDKIREHHRPYPHDKYIDSNRLGAQGFGGIKIYVGGLEIETDAGYPIEKLSSLIERLAR